MPPQRVKQFLSKPRVWVSAGPGAVAAGGAIIGSAIGNNNEVTYIAKQYVTDGGATLRAGKSGFDQALATLPPVLQEEARQLCAHWPDMEVVVNQLPIGRTSRKEILEQWAKHEPQWLASAPAPAFPWLAQLASAYDARTASFSFSTTRRYATADTLVTSWSFRLLCKQRQ